MSLPLLEVCAVFDADPLTLGIITGQDALCDGLNGWAAGNAVKTYEQTAQYAGYAAMRFTATAAGNVTATLSRPAGTVVPGRAYRLCAYVRPAAVTTRTARWSATWRTAGGAVLSTTVGTVRPEQADYGPVAEVVTAPATASAVDLVLTILGCGAGEAHLVDAITGDYAGTDITAAVDTWQVKGGGRSYEVDAAEYGQINLVLDNPDGSFTPGRGSSSTSGGFGSGGFGSGGFGGGGGSSTGPGTDTGQKITVWETATAGAVAGLYYPVGAGYARSWEQGWPGSIAAWSQVKVEAPDAFGILGRAPLGSPLVAEMLSDGPASLFPLTESSGSATAGNLAAAGVARMLTAKNGGSAWAFGADAVLPRTTAGVIAADGGALALNIGTVGGVGDVLDLSDAPGTAISFATGWSVELWAYLPPGGVLSSIFRQSSGTGNDDPTGISIYMLNTGQVSVAAGALPTVATDPFDRRGTSVHIVVTYDPYGGGWGVIRLYCGGVLTATSAALASTPLPLDQPASTQVGGQLPKTTRQLNAPFRGRVSHLGLYGKILAAQTIADHYYVGAAGGYLETDGNRIGSVLGTAGWPAADTLLDIGRSSAAPQVWAGTATPLGICADMATSAAGLFVADAAGKAMYLGRDRRYNAPVRWTFRGSTATDPEASSVRPRVDDSHVENLLQVRRVGGGTCRLTNAASVRKYGPRSPSGDLVLSLRTDREAVDAGAWRIAQHARPDVRIASVQLRPDTSDALWPAVARMRVSDRIAFDDLPGNAPATRVEQFVERITHAGGGGERTVALEVTPAAGYDVGAWDSGTWDGTLDWAF